MSNPFISSESKTKMDFDLRTLMNRTTTKGEIGLEIECEGNKFEKHNNNLGPYWEFHQDNSLRGKDNAEYVLRRPIMFDQVPEAINQLFSIMKGYGTVLDVSNRTSVHVHLNCQEFFLNRLAAFLSMYFTVEEILTEWCGEHRVGNLFCLRAKDAPSIVRTMKKFIRHDGKFELRDNLHYGGLNVYALVKYGSLEIRTLRGCTEPQTILTWVGILERLYRLSEDFQNDPTEICGMFSAEGPANFFQLLLGDHAHTVLSEIGWDYNRVSDSLYEGIRLAQDIAYCRDWGLYRPKYLKKDPFGRDPSKIAQKVMNQQNVLSQMGPTNPFAS